MRPMRRGGGRGPGIGAGSTRRSFRRCIEPARPGPCCRFVPPSCWNRRGDGRAAPSSSGRARAAESKRSTASSVTRSPEARRFPRGMLMQISRKAKYQGNSIQKQHSNQSPHQPDDSKEDQTKTLMSSLCHHHRKRKKRGPPKPTEERVITSRTAPVQHIILARSLARLHTSVTNMVKLHVTYCGG